jgi:hypothetical protein
MPDMLDRRSFIRDRRRRDQSYSENGCNFKECPIHSRCPYHLHHSGRMIASREQGKRNIESSHDFRGMLPI